MKNIIKFSFIAAMTISTLAAEKNVGAEDSVRKKIASVGAPKIVHGDEVNNFHDFFTKGKASGQFETMYSGYEEHGMNATNADPYSSAIGGQLKFDTAHWNGLGAGVEFTTVQEIKALSGDNNDGERASMMVSSKGNYTEVSQSYLEYFNNDFTFRVGRQLIDTPLADSDDIRIVNNTFQAYIATYETDSISIMAGFLEKWQGTDTGLVNNSYAPASTNAWQNTGKDGTYFVGINYENDLLHLGAWYYDISDTDADNSMGASIGNKSIYVDATLHAISGDNLTLDVSAQYLNQSEDGNSGTDADIYGFMLKAEIYDLNILTAYNSRNADDDKTSFSGFGGGTLFTNMDNMIIDAISGGDVDAYVFGATYAIKDVIIGYAYGKFERDDTATLAKEDIVENNVAAEYAASDNLTFFAIVTVDEDERNTATNAINNSGDFTNMRVSASYNF